MATLSDELHRHFHFDHFVCLFFRLIIIFFRPGLGTRPDLSRDTSCVQIHRDDIAETGAGHAKPNLPTNAKLVARNFRYMRRKPTIMAYKPPKGMFKSYVTHQRHIGWREEIKQIENF